MSEVSLVAEFEKAAKALFEWDVQLCNPDTRPTWDTITEAQKNSYREGSLVVLTTFGVKFQESYSKDHSQKDENT